MVIVNDILRIIEKWAPPSLAESWDNVGLLNGDRNQRISSVVISLDVDTETVVEAQKRDALVISHHPVIFRPLKTLAGSAANLKALREAVRRDVPLYAAHTNLDVAPGGVSDALAETLGIHPAGRLTVSGAGVVKFVTYAPKDHIDRIREAAAQAGAGTIGEYRSCSFSMSGVGSYIPSEKAAPFEGSAGKLSRVAEERLEMIVPAPLKQAVVKAVRAVHPYDEMAHELIPLDMTDATFGNGVIGELDEPMSDTDFAAHVKRSLGCSFVTVSRGAGRPVRRVAVMGGSGGSFVRRAADAGVDAYVSGDIGYHDMLDYGGSMLIVDAGHRETELPVLDAIRRRIEYEIDSDAFGLTVIRGTGVSGVE